MVAVKEIVKLASESGLEITIFDLEKLKIGIYQSCVCTAHDEKKDLEDLCREEELNIDLANLVYDIFISDGILS